MEREESECARALEDSEEDEVADGRDEDDDEEEDEEAVVDDGGDEEEERSRWLKSARSTMNSSDGADEPERKWNAGIRRVRDDSSLRPLSSASVGGGGASALSTSASGLGVSVDVAVDPSLSPPVSSAATDCRLNGVAMFDGAVIHGPHTNVDNVKTDAFG
jgi:hypothetical protein